MSTKHYTIDYLEGTGAFLKNIKEFSYNPFKEINEGVIVDLGCGTGLDVSNLGKIIGSGVEVVGIDHDENMLNKGRTSFADQGNIRFLLGESDVIPFEDSTVSGLRAERLMQHLLTPENTFKEIYRVLKPGQPVVIVETDWSSLMFYNEHLPVEKKLIQYLTETKINNGLVARKLATYLEGNGFNQIHMDIIPLVIKSLKEANEYLWIEIMLRETQQKGFMSEAEHDTFLDALKHADEKNYFACTINVVIISSVK